MKKTVTIFFISFLFSGSLMAAPGLKIGSTAPNFSIEQADSKTFKLYSELKSSPVVLLFYRGGWCPYCNLQLKSIQNEVFPKLKANGIKLLAVSVDKIAEAKKTKNTLSFPVASDSDAKVISQYNIVNYVTDEKFEMLKSYKIDIEKASGKKHRKIAIPAVFVINKSTKIVFSYANKNYKVRAQNKDILKAINNLK